MLSERCRGIIACVMQLENPKEKLFQSQEEDPEAKAELQAAAEVIIT